MSDPTTPPDAAEDAVLRSAFPSMFQGTTTATAAPPTAPVTEGDPDLRAAFPSMFTDAPPTASQSTPVAPGPAADPDLLRAFPSMAPDAGAPAASAPADAATSPTTAGRTVTFHDVGEVTIPSAAHLDDADLSALAEAARELHLDAPATQRLLDLHAQAAENLTTAADAAWRETVAGWRSAVQADGEVGGAAFAENVAVARGVIARYGTPALKAALNETGLGSHPELVRLMVRVGRALAGRQG